jgi:hypothetical protein
MGDPRDYKLDVAGLGRPERSDETPAKGRPFLGLKFNCCGTYQRVYRSDDGKWYRGRCPKCLKPVEIRVGAGGSDSRFFVVD